MIGRFSIDVQRKRVYQISHGYCKNKRPIGREKGIGIFTKFVTEQESERDKERVTIRIRVGQCLNLFDIFGIRSTSSFFDANCKTVHEDKL